MNGEDVLREQIEQAHEAAYGEGGAPALDPVAIAGIIMAILEAIRGCRNPETAGAHIRRGSAIARVSLRRALAKGGYRGRLGEMTREMIARGKSASDEQLAAITGESQDLPQPPPAEGGFWPVWVWVAALLTGLAIAGDVQAGNWWPAPAETETVTTHKPPTWWTDAGQAVPRQSHQQAHGYRPPHRHTWTFPGQTREDLIRHLAAENHRLDPATLRTKTFAELMAIHASDHEGLLDRRRVGQVELSDPVPSGGPASRGASGQARPRQPVMRTVRAGLLGRRIVRLPAAGGCPGGVCP